MTHKLTNELPQKLTHKITGGADAAKGAAVKSFSYASERLTGDAREAGKSAARWLWWWGLAAVGVYGIATTATKEGMGFLKDLASSASGAVSGSDAVSSSSSKDDE